MSEKEPRNPTDILADICDSGIDTGTDELERDDIWLDEMLLDEAGDDYDTDDVRFFTDEDMLG